MQLKLGRAVVSGCRSIRERRRIERAKLPWDEVEREASRQGCSAADIVFDRAGRRPPDADEQATPPSEAAQYTCE
jgi:hypothetical protein